MQTCQVPIGAVPVLNEDSLLAPFSPRRAHNARRHDERLGQRSLSLMFCKQLDCDEARVPRSRPFTTPLISGGLSHKHPSARTMTPIRAGQLPWAKGWSNP